MKKNLLTICSVAVALTGVIGLASCSSKDEVPANVVYDNNGTAGVKPEFVISLPRTVVSGTRMSNDVTQSEGTVAQFRGMDNIRLISFSETPTASSVKLSDILGLSAIPGDGLQAPGTMNYKVYADQFVPVGTKNFLFYGKAIDADVDQPITTMADKFNYGTLKVQGLTDAQFNTPNDIVFSLEQINTSIDKQQGDVVGQKVVELLNRLATANVTTATAPNDKWSTTTNGLLANLYKSFKAVTTSSSSTLAVILGQVYTAVQHVQATDPAYDLASYIAAQIREACDDYNVQPVVLKGIYSGYPGNIGLPDGAARVRWNEVDQKFVDITANYNFGNRTKITDYVYPAALWYYVSSPLKASTEIESREYENAGSWNNVISEVYGAAADEVQSNTQSVALSLPAQYGVGRLETRVKMGDGTFYDGNGEAVNVGAGYTLTGVLLGGQSSVGYDFATKGDENQTIYDRVMSANNIIAKPNVTTGPNHTLALQTKSNQVVYAALQLVNGGDAFMGLDGIIPTGGTFYLTAKLDPTTADNYQNGERDKIIWQDHYTRMTVTIKNGKTDADRNNDGIPDVYLKDANGVPTGVDVDGNGTPDPYDIDNDGTPDTFITDPTHGGPGWDTDGDGEVDIPVFPDKNGDYPDKPNVPGGLGNATNGVPDLSSPGIEIGTSVNLEWQEGLVINPEI